MNHNNPIYCGVGTQVSDVDWTVPQLLLGFFLFLIVVMYIVAVFISNKHYKQWPLSRFIFWVLGVMCAAFAIIGPIATRSHIDFRAHMLGHLLLGMIAPLLMVLAAPMTLVLRTLPVSLARSLSQILKSRYLRFLVDPIVISLLNIGGLWILYTTDLFVMMHHHIFLYVFVHIHVFLAGYFFTMSIIYIEPTPHRASFVYRAIVLLIALAFHGILSKYIYAYPPKGVPTTQAEMGGMLMYYGGDVIDLMLIYILFYQWFRSTQPRNGSSGRKSGGHKVVDSASYPK